LKAAPLSKSLFHSADPESRHQEDNWRAVSISRSSLCSSLQPRSLSPARMPSTLPEPVRWGPDNPHPLFGRKTELVWDGKYDEYGARRPVDIAGSAMHMQNIETVDMPRNEALAGGQITLGELKTTHRTILGRHDRFLYATSSVESLLATSCN